MTFSKKCFLLGLAFALSAMLANAQSTDNYEGVSVMSFNVRCDNGQHKDGTNSWEFRWKCTVDVVNDVKSDVVGLQELTPMETMAFKEYCPGYKMKGVGRDDGKKKGEQAALLYNASTLSLLKWGTFWLSETPDKVSTGWDAKYPRTATWAIFKCRKSGKKFLMLNTHLDHKGVKAREEGLRLVCQKVDELNKEGLPVVVTGDFNIKPDDPAFAGMEGSGLEDVRVKAEIKDQLGSFHGWGKESKIIDYIFVKGFSAIPMFRTVTQKYPDEAGEPHFVSDHYPIISCLIF